MSQPPYLQKGDKVKIISTARKISLEEVEEAAKIIRNWGYGVSFGENLFQEENQFAGSDLQRAADLQQALDDPGVKAIIFARGGYGTLRIIDLIDFTRFKTNPKWLVGYSDITVLHAHVNSLGFQTIHATMPVNFLKCGRACEGVRKALAGEELLYGKADFNTSLFKYNRPGSASGILVGGNLSLLYALVGSSSLPSLEGAILFLEDLDEYLYHIDRMMVSMKRAGLLKKLSGLIVGGMTEMKDNLVPFGKSAEEIILDAVREYNYPVAFGFPAGHIESNMPVYLGRMASLDSSLSEVRVSYK